MRGTKVFYLPTGYTDTHPILNDHWSVLGYKDLKFNTKTG